MLRKSRFIEMFGKEESTISLNKIVDEMFIGPFGSSLTSDCFVNIDEAFCMVYEQRHAIYKTISGNNKYINKEKYEELKRFTILPGDIIVSCRGTIGKTFVIPNNAPLGIMHPSIMKIRLKSNRYNVNFFDYILKDYFTKEGAKTEGSSIKMAIKASELSKKHFIYPMFSKQNEFINFSQQIDKLKFILQQKIEKLELLKKSRFIEMFGNLSSITDKTIKFKDIAEFINGFNFKSELFVKDSGIPIIRIGNIENGEISLDYNYCYPIDFYEKNIKYSLKLGDVLIALSGATVGKSGIYTLNKPSLLNQRVCILRAKKEKATAEFILSITQSAYFLSLILNKAYGGAQPNISSKIIENIDIPNVSLEQQQQYSRFVSQIDKLKLIAQKQLDFLVGQENK